MGKRARRGAEGGCNGALSRRQALIAWGFCLPFVLVFGVFMLVPLLSSMGMSFTDITSRDLRTPFNVNIVGFDNYVYQQFGFGRYGIASAASWVLFVIIAVVSVLQFRILGSDE